MAKKSEATDFLLGYFDHEKKLACAYHKICNINKKHIEFSVIVLTVECLLGLQTSPFIGPLQRVCGIRCTSMFFARHCHTDGVQKNSTDFGARV